MPAAPSHLALIRTMAAVLAGGACLGLVLNAVSPHAVPLGKPILPTSAEGTCEYQAHDVQPPRISQAEAQVACTACTAAFVDARPEEAFARGHILGAVHRPEHGHPDEAALVAKLKTYSMVVVYDDDVGCKLAEGVARHLMAEGLPDVRVLQGSWSGWEATGGPAQSGACEVCSHPSQSRPEAP